MVGLQTTLSAPIRVHEGTQLYVRQSLKFSNSSFVWNFFIFLLKFLNIFVFPPKKNYKKNHKSKGKKSSREHTISNKLVSKVFVQKKGGEKL